jgi:hypothetical protein
MSTEASAQWSELSSCVIFWLHSCEFLAAPDAPRNRLVRYARQNEQLQHAEGGRFDISSASLYRGEYAMLSEPKLYPAHVCKACGQEVLRLEMDAPTLVSGVVECPACGSSGALNIEIRSLEDRKPPVRSNGKR